MYLEKLNTRKLYNFRRESALRVRLKSFNHPWGKEAFLCNF